MCCSVNSVRSGVKEYRLSCRVREENDRLVLSGVVRQKATPVIMGHIFDHIQHNAVSSLVVGIGLLIIGGVFVILWMNLVYPSLQMLYPVTLMLSSVFVINAANLEAVIRALKKYSNIRAFKNLLQQKRQQLINDHHNRVSSSELLLMLHDAGFVGKIHEAIFILDNIDFPDTVESLLETEVISEQLHKTHSKLSRSLKNICKNIESVSSTSNCTPMSRLTLMEKRMVLDLLWSITSLILNSVACLGFFAFPLFTFLPTSSVDFNSNTMHIGGLIGNFSWMLEPLLYLIYKSSDVLDTPDVATVSKKNN
jgi:hypothetical protein